MANTRRVLPWQKEQREKMSAWEKQHFDNAFDESFVEKVNYKGKRYLEYTPRTVTTKQVVRNPVSSTVLGGTDRPAPYNLAADPDLQREMGRTAANARAPNRKPRLRSVWLKANKTLANASPTNSDEEVSDWYDAAIAAADEAERQHQLRLQAYGDIADEDLPDL